MPWLEPVTLEGRFLRLTPATRDDMAELVEATDPDTFRLYTSHPPTWDADGFWAWIQTRTPEPFLTLVMRERASGRVAGCSTFFDAREQDRALEIGYTWIRTDLRGRWANPEAKLLMVGHAIESLGCLRVQLKTDDRNEHSKNAMLKLGAKFEGVLRQVTRMPDGHQRDTAYFSILPAEWPAVKARLVERLSHFSVESGPG
jgi:N-acetyltransferase